VVGPVKADKLLEEARFAVDNYTRTRETSHNNIYLQGQLLSQAHLALAGDKVHKLLAENPLVPLALIEQRVFEKLAGQKVAQDRGQVELAAMGFQKAEQKGMPVLLVFGKAKGKPGDWDADTARVVGALGMNPLSKAARNCVLVVLPIDDLPALTNLVKLSDLRMAERATPIVVLTKSDGTQLASISPSMDPRQVADQLWEGVNQCRWEKAEKLLAEGNQREATTLLRLLKSSPQAGSLKDRAIERLAELQRPTAALSKD
jgi:hypothetical protein